MPRVPAVRPRPLALAFAAALFFLAGAAAADPFPDSFEEFWLRSSLAAGGAWGSPRVTLDPGPLPPLVFDALGEHFVVHPKRSEWAAEALPVSVSLRFPVLLTPEAGAGVQMNVLAGPTKSSMVSLAFWAELRWRDWVLSPYAGWTSGGVSQEWDTDPTWEPDSDDPGAFDDQLKLSGLSAYRPTFGVVLRHFWFPGVFTEVEAAHLPPVAVRRFDLDYNSTSVRAKGLPEVRFSGALTWSVRIGLGGWAQKKANS